LQKPPRPTGVTVLAVLEILGGVIGLAGGGLLLAAGAIINTSSFSSQYPGLSSYSSSTLSAIFYGFGAFLLILGILALVIGIGFLSGKGWSWTLAIVVGIISIVATILEIVIGISGTTAVVSIIIEIIIIYYLTRPHVKAFFGKGMMPTPSMMPPASQAYGSPPPISSPPMAGTKCRSCGMNIPAGASRCPNCGASA
jgi:hypothetical protein